MRSHFDTGRSLEQGALLASCQKHSGKAYTFSAGVVDDVFEFDPALFGLSAREAAYMDPQQRILLQTVWRAIEDARIDLVQLKQERVGVYIGASSLDSGNLQWRIPHPAVRIL